MTEKRFQIIDDDLFDNENMEVLMVDFEVYGVPRIVDVLNELNDENVQLKIQLQSTSDQRDEFFCGARENANRVGKLEKENEQLKQFKEDVFNKIDMHLRMLPTARDNEFNEDDGDPSLYVGAIYMLETLKKELKE